MKSIPIDEQETVCVYEQITGTYSVYTCVRKHITKLLKIFSEDQFDKIERNEEGRIIAVQIDGIDEAHVLLRDKPKGRKLTEEQKEEIAERLKTARDQKKHENVTELQQE